MMQAYVEKPIAYRLVVAASTTLGGSWFSYLACLGGATITKQACIFGASRFTRPYCLLSHAWFLVSRLAQWAILHSSTGPAALWGAHAILVAVIVSVVTRPLINGAA